MQTKSQGLTTQSSAPKATHVVPPASADLPSGVVSSPSPAEDVSSKPVPAKPTERLQDAAESSLGSKAALGIFWGLAGVTVLTYLLTEGTAKRSSDIAVIALGLSTIVSLTLAVWVWWKELAQASLSFSRAVVTPWFCFFVGLGIVTASHLWMSASNPAAFAAMNPLNSVPVLIAVTAVLRELLKRTTNGINLTEWERELERVSPPPLAELSTTKGGDIVLCDSKIKKGSVVVRERWLSPIPELRVRDEQDVLFAGSKIVVGEAEIQSLTPTSSSVLSQLLRSVRAAGPKPARPLEQSTWSNIACFACLCVAASVGIFWNERGVSAVSSVTFSATILCGAVFFLLWQSAVDMAVNVTRALWRTGVFVRSRSAFEKLRKVRHLAFVRDGSTIGLPRVVGFDVLDDRYDREALAGVLLALSGRADDPWQQAICRYLDQSELPLALLRAADFREYDGRGISAVIQGVEFTLGTESFVLDRGVQLQSGDTCPPEAEVDHVLYLAIQRYVVLRLSLKWDEKSELESMRRFLGDRVSLVSVVKGAQLNSEKASDAITVLSGDKAALEASLLSDAPDLVIEGGQFPDLFSRQSVSVSRYSGTSFELPDADVVLFSNELAAVGRAREVSEKVARWELRQRGIVVGLSGATIIATMAGLGSPVVAVLLAGAACMLSMKPQRFLDAR